MPRFKNPTILLTRPRESSLRFVEALSDEAGTFTPLIAPAFETVAIEKTLPAFDAAVFTSQVGPRFAPDGNGRPAYCVGDITTSAARDRGYDAISAAGAVQDLVDLILKHLPQGRLLHIRGEKSVGNISANLKTLGLTCNDAIVYRKQPQALNQIVSAKIEGAKNLIIPVFSAETVSIIERWGMQINRVQIVAISDAVAQASRVLNPTKIIVSNSPDLRGMITSTSALIA